MSLQPETLHTIMWLISDRALPRSFRVMQGFGVNTFRFVNAKGEGTFVKFHWTPTLGVHSLIWEKCRRVAGKDPDFNRRDLWDAIEAGQYPEWELGVPLVPEIGSALTGPAGCGFESRRRGYWGIMSNPDNPIDYARTAQARTGMVVKDRRELPGVLLLIVAAVTLVGFMTSAAMQSVGWMVGLGTATLFAGACGVAWILVGRSRFGRQGNRRLQG